MKVLDIISKRDNPLEILIVDDDKIFGLLHKVQLKSIGSIHRPVVCTNGKQAIDHIEHQEMFGANYLVLLDLNMPVMNGWELLRELERKVYYRRIFVIVVSSSDNNSDRTRALAYEQVIGFCKKPIDIEAVKRIGNLRELRQFFNRTY